MSSNLANVAAPGNTRAVSHGAFSERLVGPIAEEILEAVVELCAGLPAEQPGFAAARALLARKLARLSMVSQHLDSNGYMNQRGNPRPSVKLELELLRSVEVTLAALGLTPSAAAKLGVDLARSHTLSDELEDARQARLRAEVRHGQS
jgi:hypothetical protein